MPAICSWCHARIGPAAPEPREAAGSDICVLCASFIRTNRLLPLRDYMHGVARPILFVGGDGIVLGGNRAVQGALGKSSSQIEGFRGGDVIQCAFAKLPGGCGGTEYCATCPIRNCVMHTMRTGQGLDGIKAARPISVGADTTEMCFVLTTRLVEDAVLLGLDEMGPCPMGSGAG